MLTEVSHVLHDHLVKVTGPKVAVILGQCNEALTPVFFTFAVGGLENSVRETHQDVIFFQLYLTHFVGQGKVPEGSENRTTRIQRRQLILLEKDRTGVTPVDIT